MTDPRGSSRAIEAAREAIVTEVYERLGFNVAAYGKAWTGEGEDSEFIVGEAAPKAIDAYMQVRSFNDLVADVRLMLDTHYPADVFPGTSGEGGPGFVAKLREALAVLA